MKKSAMRIGLMTVAIILSISAFGQKPKKTFQSEVFAKKVKFSFTPEYVNSRSPNAAALAYISEKSGKPLSEIQEEDKKNQQAIKEDLQEFATYGLIFTLDKTEEKIKEETPVKFADIIMYCNSGAADFKITLTNCVQTNISWYLGDGVTFEGEMFSKLDDQLAEKKAKEDAEKAKRDKKKNEKARIQYVADSTRVARPGFEALSSSFRYDENYEGLPMKGYYVLNDGSKVEATIAYQKPEFFVGDFAAGASLFICKELNSQKVDLLNPDNETNFKEFIEKSKIKAFFINGHLYKNYKNVGWRIALTEGAIHSFITVVKTEQSGNVKYTSFKQTQKLDGTPYGTIISSITTNNLLSLMSDSPDVVETYNNGSRTINQTEVAYNIWYQYTDLDAIQYLFGSDYGRTEFNQKYPEKDDVGSGKESEGEKTTNDIGLPAEFEELANGWTFKAIYDGDLDMTAEYDKALVNGKPMMMDLMDDGTLMYQKGYRDKNNISYSQWSYLKAEDRKENEPEIDFTIKTWDNNGGWAVAKYTLVSVTATELIYENKKLKLRFVWTK